MACDYRPTVMETRFCDVNMADGSASVNSDQTDHCNGEFVERMVFSVNSQMRREETAISPTDDRPFSRIFGSMELSPETYPLSDDMAVGYSVLRPATEEYTPEKLAEAWEMNYHESSIYLEEGENNDKFDLHPQSKDALPAYILVHNSWFYSLDLLAAVLLMGLAISENPAVPGLAVSEGIHASLELLCLSVMGVELVMKLRWMGLHPFFHHRRTVAKLVVLIVMIIEALVVLGRQTSHFRVTRALRPMFLIDNHYCKGIRRVIRQILQSLPPILDMLTLLLFFMIIFSVLGFYLFGSIKENTYFSTLEGSFVSLFVLLTTANFPDVMMPSYAQCKWSSIFFIAYLVIHVYFLMNLSRCIYVLKDFLIILRTGGKINPGVPPGVFFPFVTALKNINIKTTAIAVMLAVVYETFTRIEKDKFRKLLLHRRKACQLAFRLLVTQGAPSCISFCHFEGLMKYYKPKNGRIDNYLMFKTLDMGKTGSLNIEEFFHVYEASPLKWRPRRPEDLWFSDLTGCPRKMFKGIHKLVTWHWTDFVINLVIAANGVWQLIEAAKLSATDHYEDARTLSNSISILFISFYTLEVVLKVFGLGFMEYFHSNWNRFDFGVTLLAIAGLIAEQFHIPFAFVLVLRPFRLLRLFKLKKRYRDVLGTLFIILPRFLSVALVLLLVYYFFAIIGVEVLSTYDMINCCKNTTVEQFYRFDNDSSLDGYYYLNNFSNFLASGITLFELMVVNNWFIIMDGYAHVCSEWSRIFFMSFYVVTMVVINIVVAFVLEAFLFRIQYKRVMGDMDKDSLAKVDISLTREELDFCYAKVHFPTSQLALYANDLSPQRITYRGTRTRTKFSFSLKMYEEEVKIWLKEAAEEGRKEREIVLSRLQEAGIQQLDVEEQHQRSFAV